MNIVLDTNVLVSGILRPFSAPGEIVRLVSAGHITLCVDGRLLAEYAEVLRRPTFMFEPGLVTALLDQVRRDGVYAAGEPVKTELPDPDDRPCIEVAIASRARCIVTGNKRHFPASACEGITVVSPRQFVNAYRKRTATSDE